ncbi:MAG: S46 family peptidase, partial [Bacteroidales bacterium]|nr:S46 family peptidase [Bacteroidales bacterium]
VNEMNVGANPYPDANFTERLTYGTVQDYKPKDGVLMNYFTTTDGVLEKEIPGDYEFDVPAKLKTLLLNKDYGRYADKDGTLHACFLTDNDITGGNSGSPVIDGRGNLIGLAFDGNSEAMCGDWFFNTKLQRCINVDIRYVLFIIDKYGNCQRLIKELTFAK